MSSNVVFVVLVVVGVVVVVVVVVHVMVIDVVVVLLSFPGLLCGQHCTVQGYWYRYRRIRSPKKPQDPPTKADFFFRISFLRAEFCLSSALKATFHALLNAIPRSSLSPVHLLNKL
jgi:hypothetical protein